MKFVFFAFYGGFYPAWEIVRSDVAEIWHGSVYHNYLGTGCSWSCCRFCGGLAMLTVSISTVDGRCDVKVSLSIATIQRVAEPKSAELVTDHVDSVLEDD